MDNQKGYTLSEMIVVLTAISCLLLLFFPLQSSLAEEVKKRYFIEQFENDLLLAQQLTIQNHPNYWLMINSSSNHYYLYDSRNRETIFERYFPDNWSIQLQSLTTPIRFNSTGTLYNPGTMKITTPRKELKITFPFGKSRVKIVEQ
ncbi:type II secretion system GspH family protein [Halobacillus sp. A1]|uniref:competence type IV pilus minor pilin ComGD n=1 Tax=Halobacillus sp. A1 TaxID=2880262 RepID=UPI0020A6A69B|nr:competence type IV pilus minor pilin ComGD [Halobacillus sp. A1]MCP3030301.1 type II secretion system GspH family protein [Halobacillus sp. A1]